MKKIILLAVVAVIVLLPLIGNKVIEATLDEKIKLLSSNGVEVKRTKINSNYLQTSTTFEFIVTNSDEFIMYLNQYSDKQIPPYVKMMFDGMHIGMDLSYSNILFNDSLEIDIYPLSLSDKIANDLQKDDENFYKYIMNFLKTKGLLYHLNYDLSSEVFDGYIKDIDEKYTSTDAIDTNFIINKVTYSGKGTLLNPSQIESSIGSIIIKSDGNKQSLNLIVKDIKSSSKLKTKTTYTTTASVRSLKLNTKSIDSAECYLKDLIIDFSSDTESKKAKFSASSSFKEFFFKTSVLDIRLFDFNYDIKLKNIDKDAFESLREQLVKAQTDLSAGLQMKISNSIFNLLSKGLVLDIKDISIAKIAKNSTKAVDAFSIKTLLIVKEDKNLLKNINTNPSKFLKNITIDSNIKISKEFFKMMNKELPISVIAGGFAKELGDNYIFDIGFKDLKLNINDKVIK